MVQFEHHPHLQPESLEYGEYVIGLAAAALRQRVDVAANRQGVEIDVEIKTNIHGAKSPVTEYDKATERFIGMAYAGTSVRVRGEEGMTHWPQDAIPTLNLEVDPIDGTEEFVKFYGAALKWHKLPVESEEPFPTGFSMVSAGAVPIGQETPSWGVAAAPFIAEDGVVLWSAGPNSPAQRAEPNGTRQQLPQAHALAEPKERDIVLVSSNSSEARFKRPIQAAGYRVVKCKSAVAAALSTMDPTLFDRIMPGIRRDSEVVGAVMRTAENWDVAATMAIAQKLGHVVCATDGSPRRIVEGATSAIFARRETLQRKLVDVIAPHLHSS